MLLASRVAVIAALSAALTLSSVFCTDIMAFGGNAAESGYPPHAHTEQDQRSGYEVPSSDIPNLQAQALLGSPDAAYKLWGHFTATGATETGMYWLMIAIENGNSEARLTMARVLTHNADPISRMRGHYWYRRIAAEAAPAEAQQARDELAAAKQHEEMIGLSVP